MLIRPPTDIAPSEITPPEIYRDRRRFMQGMGALVAGAALVTASDAGAGTKLAGVRDSIHTLDEKPTPYKDVTTYNNFYEFGTGKDDPADRAGSLKARPWTVAIEGEVRRPQTWDIDALLKLAPLEERVYRMRCVEGWSMVIPWVGFPLNEIIRRAQQLHQRPLRRESLVSALTKKVLDQNTFTRTAPNTFDLLQRPA